MLGQQVFADMHMIVEAMTSARRTRSLNWWRIGWTSAESVMTIHLEPKEYVEQDITFSGTHG